MRRERKGSVEGRCLLRSADFEVTYSEKYYGQSVDELKFLDLLFKAKRLRQLSVMEPQTALLNMLRIDIFVNLAQSMGCIQICMSSWIAASGDRHQKHANKEKDLVSLDSLEMWALPERAEPQSRSHWGSHSLARRHMT